MPNSSLPTCSDDNHRRAGGQSIRGVESYAPPRDPPRAPSPRAPFCPPASVHSRATRLAHIPLRLRRKSHTAARENEDLGWDADQEAEDSRASSVAPTGIDVEVADDERPFSGRPRPSRDLPAQDKESAGPHPAATTPQAFHPPMLAAPPEPESPLHPPMLSADVAREMQTKRAELRASALIEDDPFAHRLRSTESGPAAARARLRRYNPDYLLAARRWRAHGHLTSLSGSKSAESSSESALAAQRKLAALSAWDSASVLSRDQDLQDTSLQSHSADPSVCLCPHCLTISHAPGAHTCTYSHSPSACTSAACIHGHSPRSTPHSAAPAVDWDMLHAHFAYQRASLAHVRRATADAERAMLGSWALVEELVRQRSQGVGSSTEAGWCVG